MLLAYPLCSQDATPDTDAKGKKKLVLQPNPMQLRVGETKKVEISAIDEHGAPLAAGKSGMFALRETGVVPSSGVLSDTVGNLTGMEVGTYNLVVFWSNPDRVFLKDYYTVKVVNWDPAKVELIDLPDRAMEGSVLTVAAHVEDQKGYPIADAQPIFSSSNPKVAQIDAFNQLRLLKPGKTKVTASIGAVRVTQSLVVTASTVNQLELEADHQQIRTGDVLYFRPMINGSEAAADMPLTFSISGLAGQNMSGASASIREDGAFVAEQEGFYTINVSAGGRTASRSVKVVPRAIERDIEVVGRGTMTRKHTTDFWLWEGADKRDYAVTGTFSADGMAYFWDITNPGAIELIDSIQVDARIVNDVKISEDGTLCIISREGASSRKNGIVLLDVTNPRDVQIHSEYHQQLTGGVHNLFIYDDHVYALSNGQHYEIINVADPKNPHKVGRFEIDNPARAIHDVWVEDGIAYSSNWNDGVIMVDVGNGVAGGSPSNPVEISRTKVEGDANHTTFPFRSPSANKFYVVAGDEIFPLQWLSKGLTETLQPRGYVHFIDWTDKDNPKEVASYQVPEAGAHNYWVEDETLYIGYYTGGVRVVDLSGELMGDLYKQGREIGYFVPRDPQGKVANMAMTWGARPYKGHIFFTDMNTGLWAVRVKPTQPDDQVPVNVQD